MVGKFAQAITLAAEFDKDGFEVIFTDRVYFRSCDRVILHAIFENPPAVDLAERYLV